MTYVATLSRYLSIESADIRVRIATLRYESQNQILLKAIECWSGTDLQKGGFGVLVVSMLASGTRVRGFKPGRSHRIFQASENSSACLPSEGK
jgi:hypothetical protein